MYPIILVGEKFECLNDFCISVFKICFIKKNLKTVLKKAVMKNVFGNFVFENCFRVEKMEKLVW
jgi:hypothetical protein